MLLIEIVNPYYKICFILELRKPNEEVVRITTKAISTKKINTYLYILNNLDRILKI